MACRNVREELLQNQGKKWLKLRGMQGKIAPHKLFLSNKIGPIPIYKLK